MPGLWVVRGGAACDGLAASPGCQKQVVTPLSLRYSGQSPVHLCSPALFGLQSSSSSSCPHVVWWGCISVGLSCPPHEPVLVPAGAHFSPWLKTCMLSPCSGVLPGCCVVGVRRRSLLSWGELWAALAQGITPSVHHLPPHTSLLGWSQGLGGQEEPVTFPAWCAAEGDAVTPLSRGCHRACWGWCVASVLR